MENRSRENVERFKKEEGRLQVYAQSEDHTVQVPVGNLIIQATALAVTASIQEAKGSLELEYYVGCCFRSIELRPRTVGRGLNSIGGRLKPGKPSIAALLQATGIPTKMVRPRQRLLSRRGSARGGSSRQ